MRIREVIILVNTGNCSGRDLLRGILRFATSSKCWNIRICDLADHGEERFLKLIGSIPTDGVITSELENPEIAATLECSSVPLSVIGTRKNALPARNRNMVTITTDEVSVGSLGAQALLKCGVFNSYAFVNMRHAAYRYLSSLREKGFVQQIRKVDRAPFIFGATRPETESDETELRTWLCTLPRPAAILVASDARAEEVLRAAIGAKLRVPRDVAILGIDDDEFKCLSTTPMLSSIHLDGEEQGYEAAFQLNRMLNRRNGGHQRSSRFVGHTHVVERESTRTLTPGGTLVARAKKFIASNADHSLTVKDVLNFTRVSERLLFLRFREFSDHSVKETINAERIRYFCRRLRTSNGSIREVAAHCGFKNMATLRSLFTAATGLTIREWRKRQSAGTSGIH